MTDRNVKSVAERLYQRADEGMRKYGVSTERDDLDFESWLQHLQDELLDGAVYIAKLRTETVPQSLDRAEAAEAALKVAGNNWSELRIVLDADKARAEATEARCARLVEAHNKIINWPEPHFSTYEAAFKECKRISRAALQETGAPNVLKAIEESRLLGRGEGRAQMRESAAKWLREEIDILTPTDERERAYVDGLRHALEGIRALPIDAETPALEDDNE